MIVKSNESEDDDESSRLNKPDLCLQYPFLADDTRMVLCLSSRWDGQFDIIVQYVSQETWSRLSRFSIYQLLFCILQLFCKIF